MPSYRESCFGGSCVSVSYIVAVHAEVGRAMQAELVIAEFEDGRTDLVGPLLEAGVPANFRNQHGVSLIQTCA
jgi:hypothetical protein